MSGTGNLISDMVNHLFTRVRLWFSIITATKKQMARKLFVNNTEYLIQGTLAVRQGSNTGTALYTVSFTINPRTQQNVNYGDLHNPYADGLEVSAIENGTVVLTEQITMQEGGITDKEFNTNDTIYINMTDSNRFMITAANTWTI